MLNGKMIMTGFLSALLACSGGAIMIVQAAAAAGLSTQELVTWFTSVYVIGGLLNLLLTLIYKIPFAGAHSITAAAFLSTAAAGFSFSQLAGAFVMSGVIILICGLTGIFSKALFFLPKSLIDALLAGLLLSYIVGVLPASIQLPYAGVLAGVGYFVVPRFLKRLPPVLWAMLLGLIGLSFDYAFPAIPDAAFLPPMFVHAQFTWEAFMGLAIPMSVLILSNDLAVALASLKGNGFRPPVNKALTASGIAGMTAGLFGGSAANVGGLMSALCSSEEVGPQASRYKAAIVSSLLVIAFGIGAWRVIDYIQVLPPHFVAMMTGYSLLGLFLAGLRTIVADRNMRIPAIATFVVAAFHIQLLGIATPVWALLVGMIVMKAKARLHPRSQSKR
ncbi:Benzoate membrane transporter [Paenibacillus sp. 598K]|uniref:benzoate/H(+) symporter BenE family transporter n=1 Tax=Paenibacillus sp. 598K TaxID=1117987 RepID=UPI000FF91598|nr:benzoate/H(+) symporter BenE family transporter [Paenibacillus sp. 598K]GBF73552.1 Benzoate membrane transporter [Paenibacillus sp. 598K]